MTKKTVLSEADQLWEEICANPKYWNDEWIKKDQEREEREWEELGNLLKERNTH